MSRVADKDTLAHPGALAIGTRTETMQSAGDTDWFKVSLTAGDTYSFTETGLDVGAWIYVVPASDAVDISNSVSPSTLPSGSASCTYTADTTGTYYVAVQDDFGVTGAYSLSMSRVADKDTLANPGALAIGTRTETMQSAGDTDWFKVSLTAGDTYSFTETGLDVDAGISVVSASDAVDIYNLVSPATLPSGSASCTFTADTTGTYYVAVQDDFGLAGAYSLSMSHVADKDTLANPGALAIGTRTETMQSAGDTDWFKVSLTAGDTYSFAESGLDLETWISVLPASEAVDISDPVSSLTLPSGSASCTYTADTTGTYYVAVRDDSGLTGAYSLSMSRVADSLTLAHPGAL